MDSARFEENTLQPNRLAEVLVQRLAQKRLVGTEDEGGFWNMIGRLTPEEHRAFSQYAARLGAQAILRTRKLGGEKGGSN